MKEIFRDVNAGSFYADNESLKLKLNRGPYEDEEEDDDDDDEDGENNDDMPKEIDTNEIDDNDEDDTIKDEDGDLDNNMDNAKNESKRKKRLGKGKSTSELLKNKDDNSRLRSTSDIVGDANQLRSVSSRNIENLMESFAGDSGDSGVNRVFKMLTSSRAGPDMNTEHEAIEVEVQILEQLTVGCPSLRSGVNGMFCPVDKDLPSTVVAYSLASLRTHAALDAYFNNAFGGAGNTSSESISSPDLTILDSTNDGEKIEAENNNMDDNNISKTLDTNGVDGENTNLNQTEVQKDSSVDTNTESKDTHDAFYVLDTPRKKRMVLVSNEECDIVDKFKDVEEGRSFEVVTYFAAQFYALRRSYLDEETEEDYIQSLVQSRPWRTSGGKSSAQFSKTLDGRFVIKCVSAEEFNMFHHQCACGVYFVYMDKTIFQNCPSALVKIMGMHRIKIKNPSGSVSIKYVVIMQNLFAGIDTTNMRLFDLKGKIRYYTKRVQKGTVLLDGDLLRMTNGLPLPLTKESNELVGDAINNDSLFLKIADIVDYSLIIGIDRRTKTVRMGVIDFMHSYDMKKRLESNLKGIISEATIRPPTVYSDRFLNGFETYFCAVPQKSLQMRTHHRRISSRPKKKIDNARNEDNNREKNVDMNE